MDSILLLKNRCILYFDNCFLKCAQIDEDISSWPGRTQDSPSLFARALIVSSIFFVLYPVLGLTVIIGYTGSVISRMAASGIMIVIVGIPFPFVLLWTRFQLLVLNTKIMA